MSSADKDLAPETQYFRIRQVFGDRDQNLECGEDIRLSWEFLQHGKNSGRQLHHNSFCKPPRSSKLVSSAHACTQNGNSFC